MNISKVLLKRGKQMLNIETSAFIMIDIQEKLVNAAYKGDKVAENAAKLAKTANILGIKTIVTEQYPKGLGATVSNVAEVLSENAFVVEKSSFSVLAEENIANIVKELKNSGISQIFICGIETHICLFQTVQDLITEGFEVHVIKDASSSRDKDEHKAGLELMKKYGAYITTVEIILFELLKTSKHPHFKEIQNLIK